MRFPAVRNHPDPSYGSQANIPVGAATDPPELIVRSSIDGDPIASRGAWHRDPATGAMVRVESPQYDRDRGLRGLYMNPVHSMGQSLGAVSAPRIYIARFHASRVYTIQNIAFVIGVTPTTADTGVDVGIYGTASNGTDLTLLASNGAATTNQLLTASSVKAMALSAPLTLQPGVYYAAWQAFSLTGAVTVGLASNGATTLSQLAGTAVGQQEFGIIVAGATTLPGTLTWASVVVQSFAPVMFGREF